MIKNPKEYSKFISDMFEKAQTLSRDFKTLFNGGHSKDDKSGVQAHKFGREKEKALVK